MNEAIHWHHRGWPSRIGGSGNVAHRGYQVHVYDRYDRVGGLLIYASPALNLKKTLLNGVAIYCAMGVTFHLGVDVGSGAHTLTNYVRSMMQFDCHWRL